MPILHKLAAALIVCAVVLGLTLPGPDRHKEQATKARAAGAATRTAPPTAPGPSPSASGSGKASASPSASASPTPPAKLAAATPAAVAAKANELGEVPVLMYHRIMKKPEASLDRSTKELHDELTRLAKEGYMPITAAEFVSGRIDVPAGKHPVVLTFDDSTPGHFGLDAQGNPKPDTAVSIILDVAKQNPGFRPVATFYLNKDLFLLGPQESAGLKWLIQHGFEVGNHTVTHPDLSRMSKDAVQKEIGGMESKIVSLTGAHTTTFAYPFGAAPKKRSWAESKDGEYDFRGIFLAGWKPSESPFSKDFDRFAILRVRSEGKIKENDCKLYCSTAWLDWLDKHPGDRFTSDGDPNTISFPAAGEKSLAKDYRQYGRTY
ncbi:polysaccharide deacetylase family protein [Actinomadura barringtoniae]|uniref:Polysaccharide deacetylase family protein n=2 Tax=Actinomadura barringtoniae TaxID=1427535 RepID=A0A939PGM7_9ACTN|nr:polysaccharide deacetylase family protein [Actinomadura barringtoniae]